MSDSGMFGSDDMSGFDNKIPDNLENLWPKETIPEDVPGYIMENAQFGLKLPHLVTNYFSRVLGREISLFVDIVENPYNGMKIILTAPDRSSSCAGPLMKAVYPIILDGQVRLLVKRAVPCQKHLSDFPDGMQAVIAAALAKAANHSHDAYSLVEVDDMAVWTGHSSWHEVEDEDDFRRLDNWVTEQLKAQRNRAPTK